MVKSVAEVTGAVHKETQKVMEMHQVVEVEGIVKASNYLGQQ